MPGFGDLLEVLAAIDARGKSVIDTFGGSELDRARADVERLAALLATMDPSRAGGLSSQLEAARARVSLLESRGGTAAGDERPSGATEAASPMDRVAFQMRTMAAAVNESAAEAERTLSSLSAHADEVTAQVQVKVSKALAKILDPGSGPGVSGKFDEKTGQFLGGAFSFEAARDLVDRYGELLDLQKTARGGADQFYVNQAIQQTANHFRQVFGPQLGDIRKLLKELRAYEAATAKNDRAGGPASGSLGRVTPTPAPAQSLAVLRWSGRLR